jgi:hypothetical protein
MGKENQLDSSRWVYRPARATESSTQPQRPHGGDCTKKPKKQQGVKLLVVTKGQALDTAHHLRRFRELGYASLQVLQQSIGTQNHKELASAINSAMQKSLRESQKLIVQFGLPKVQNLEAMLALHYAMFVVMLELRNEVWAYEYMAFSRRIGELWEDFIRVVFDHAPRQIEFFNPPLFSQVRTSLRQEIQEFVKNLPLEPVQKQELLVYYQKVWTLVDSGQISLELDLHFIQQNRCFNVDLKSGFGSNEKGNTNRLLMVATIYKSLDSDYTNLLLVRAAEDQNNHYFKLLRDSGVWTAHCGKAAYQTIEALSDFGLLAWMNTNMNWRSDLSQACFQHLTTQNLLPYLEWSYA